ncbi:MAG TPA: AraC family transcriptional regulator [Microlunatus sp.]|nr:AraC family transcriptional regulator [Microlunatus sp.]
MRRAVDRLRRPQVFGSAGYPVAGAMVTLSSSVDEHTHDFLEVAVVLAGRATYLSPLGPRPIGPGAVTAVRPGQWHGFAQPDRAVIGNLYLGEELLHAELRWLLEIGDLGRFLLRGGLADGHLSATSRDRVRRRLAELAELTATPGTADAIRATGAAYGILAELARVPLVTDGPGGLSGAVRQTLLLLARRPAEPWTVARLAGEAGLSVSHLHREFRAQLGLTPMAWLAKTRAEVAASLLLQTDRPVGWVGRQVGWDDPNYFSRCFRRAYGMSPTTYRQRYLRQPRSS